MLKNLMCVCFASWTMVLVFFAFLVWEDRRKQKGLAGSQPAMGGRSAEPAAGSDSVSPAAPPSDPELENIKRVVGCCIDEQLPEFDDTARVVNTLYDVGGTVVICADGSYLHSSEEAVVCPLCQHPHLHRVDVKVLLTSSEKFGFERLRREQ